MLGLRTIESSEFISFFEIVQKTAEKENKIFYFDTGDGRDIKIDGIEGEDLMGWLIPKEESKAFEEKWKRWEELDCWNDYFCWAVWENDKGLTIKFEFNS